MAESCAGWTAAAILWFWVRSVCSTLRPRGSGADPFVRVPVGPGLFEVQWTKPPGLCLSEVSLQCTDMMMPTCSCTKEEVGD